MGVMWYMFNHENNIQKMNCNSNKTIAIVMKILTYRSNQKKRSYRNLQTNVNKKGEFV